MTQAIPLMHDHSRRPHDSAYVEYVVVGGNVLFVRDDSSQVYVLPRERFEQLTTDALASANSTGQR